MRSARWTASVGIEVIDVDRPTPRPNEALIRVSLCGICGSDIEELSHGPVVATSPVVLGHEISGVVASAALDGSGPVAGTRVVVDVVVGCGTCQWCMTGEEGLCPDLRVIGQHLDGGLSEYVVARADRLIAIPDSMSDIEATMAEPLAVAVRALGKIGDLASTRVLIIGGGTIGLLTAQVARSLGASRVGVLEPSTVRRTMVQGWGIQSLWSDTSHGRREATVQLFDGLPGVVIECSGRPGMTAEALTLVDKAGTVVALGVLTTAEPIDTLDMVLGEKILRGSAAHRWDTDVRRAVELIAGRQVDVAPLVSRVIPLDDTTSAFDLAAQGDESIVKVMVDCRPSTTPSITEE
jgi:(R,R)-butanediol dehydrogenase/meso-butanediol dehydrogenase/diacetyl reductase